MSCKLEVASATPYLGVVGREARLHRRQQARQLVARGAVVSHYRLCIARVVLSGPADLREDLLVRITPIS